MRNRLGDGRNHHVGHCRASLQADQDSLHLLLQRVATQFRGEAQMIELRHLRYFIAVAEELNFRRAAERIHIDQTPLSRTIRDLEERLGVTLFVRAPRRLQLTPAGVKLLDQGLVQAAPLSPKAASDRRCA